MTDPPVAWKETAAEMRLCVGRLKAFLKWSKYVLRGDITTPLETVDAQVAQAEEDLRTLEIAINDLGIPV